MATRAAESDALRDDRQPGPRMTACGDADRRTACQRPDALPDGPADSAPPGRRPGPHARRNRQARPEGGARRRGAGQAESSGQDSSQGRTASKRRSTRADEETPSAMSRRPAGNSAAGAGSGAGARKSFTARCRDRSTSRRHRPTVTPFIVREYAHQRDSVARRGPQRLHRDRLLAPGPGPARQRQVDRRVPALRRHRPLSGPRRRPHGRRPHRRDHQDHRGPQAVQRRSEAAARDHAHRHDRRPGSRDQRQRRHAERRVHRVAEAASSSDGEPAATPSTSARTGRAARSSA